jgi:dCMP deaminase
MQRIEREQYFIEIAKITAKRSICPRKQVGAVLVKDGRIIATGYNGVLPKEEHKFALNPDGSSATIHAEANLIAFCAKEGIPTKGTTLYTTLSPCDKCAELIIQAGIIKVNYIEEYRDLTGVITLVNNDIDINLKWGKNEI